IIDMLLVLIHRNMSKSNLYNFIENKKLENKILLKPSWAFFIKYMIFYSLFIDIAEVACMQMSWERCHEKNFIAF
ncbi:hypothetical protein, partial [Candidatus Enterococcus murrayae]